MNTSDRRRKIMNILTFRRHTTARELAEELGVTTRTIRNDVQALSPEFPIYTQQGGNGGIFLIDGAGKYHNSLSHEQLECLEKVAASSGTEDKKTILSIINEFGPYCGKDT